MVKVPAALVLPTATLPKASGLGDTVAAWKTPVPVSETGEPVTAELPLIVTVPFSAPPGETGVNCTRMVQVRPAVKAPPQAVPPPAAGLEYGPVKTMLLMVKDVVPPLVRVRVWKALVVPMATLPNASEVGATLTPPPPVEAAPVPLSATGDPVTATLAVMVSVPFTKPTVVPAQTPR